MRTIGHIQPDMTRSAKERAEDRKIRYAERAALASLLALEHELREQASGSQDGYLLNVANRISEALKSL